MQTLADVQGTMLYIDKIEDSMTQSIKFCLVRICIVTYLELWFRHGYIKE
jgi:hypothetical protein